MFVPPPPPILLSPLLLSSEQHKRNSSLNSQNDPPLSNCVFTIVPISQLPISRIYNLAQFLALNVATVNNSHLTWVIDPTSPRELRLVSSSRAAAAAFTAAGDFSMSALCRTVSSACSVTSLIVTGPSPWRLKLESLALSPSRFLEINCLEMILWQQRIINYHHYISNNISLSINNIKQSRLGKNGGKFSNKAKREIETRILTLLVLRARIYSLCR
jgi:hypothetical protein